jgi:hypothetical protein
MVDGREVWFESDGADLSIAGEAFGCAFLIPAVATDRRLIVEATASATWMDNADRALGVVTDWWEWPKLMPIMNGLEDRERVSDRVGLCFTGGVDSFFTLLEGPHDVAALITVHGFDILISDTDRLASSEADIRRVAEALDLDVIVVRTNLREHPTFAAISWETTHGSALAAVGHLLRSTIGTLVISSSAHRTVPRPWGSDWRLDPHWTSDALVVEHFGEMFWRFEKLERIAADPLVRENLRVCWEHRSDEPNCSMCEKCLRTMITLESLDLLEGSPRFDAGPIAQRLESIPEIRANGNRREFGLMMDKESDPEVASAVRELLERSAPLEELPALDDR